MTENELLPGHKLVFDSELQQYIQVPLEPGERVGIRERLPQAEGYEYPGGLSFFPFRRKQSEWKGIPYAQSPEAPLELTIPGFARTMLNDLWLAFTGAGRAAAGEFTQNELEEVGMRAGSALTWGGMMVPKPTGAVSGIFGGRAAKTANAPMLAKAMSLESKGASPPEILVATGWFKDVDGNWKFEISDEGAKLTPGVPRNPYNQELTNIPMFSTNELKMKDVLDHPELYKAYPDIAEMPVRSTGLNFGLKGAHDAEKNTIYLSGQKDKDTVSTALHETQHAIQSREGFARGGNVDEWLTPEFQAKAKEVESSWEASKKEIADLGINTYSAEKVFERLMKGEKLDSYYQEIAEKLGSERINRMMPLAREVIAVNQAKADAFETYRSLAGEVESRNVQERFENPTRAMPWETPGYIPKKNQLVLFDQKKGALSASADPNDFSPSEKEVYSSSLKEFEEAYDAAEKELKYWGKHYSLELAPDGVYVVKKNGEDLEYHPDSAIGEIMSKLQAAANKYDAAIKGAEIGPKDALNEFNEAYAKAQSELKAGGWTEDWFAIEADPDTGYFVPKAWGGNFIPANGGKLASIFDELNKAKDKYVTAAGVPEDFIPYIAPTKKTNELNAPKTNEPVDLSEFEQVPYSPDDYVKPKSKGKLFGVKDAPPSYLEQMKPEQMREYSPSELDWEYQREYVELSKHLFPDAFKDRADFQKQYDSAPLRVLTQKELKNLEYATLGGVLGATKSEADKIADVMSVAGHRRDVPKIMEAIRSGQTAPPIVLRHDDGMRLLGGNTRLMSALALGKNMPVKVIDIRSLPRRGSHKFDPLPPTTPQARAENFNRWFEGSKVVDEQGDPLILYHGTRAYGIEAFDPEKIRKKSGGSRDFVSLSSSPKFASEWAGAPDDYIDEQPSVYPVYVSAKNPGDFRNPEHVQAAAEWKTEQELKNLGWSPENVKKARDRARVPRPTLIGDADVKQFKSTLQDQIERAESGIWTFWEDPAMWKHFGWDGVFMKENADWNAPLNFAAPNPSQIKSIFNKGWWSKDDPRILYSGGAPLPLDLEPVDYDPFELEPVAGDPFVVEEKKE